VGADASVRTASGLGPLYDARSCDACHQGGGAGRAGSDAAGPGLVLRLGTAGGRPDPRYGAQLQRRAVAGAAPEARARLVAIDGELGHRPAAEVQGLAYGPLAPGVHVGLRRAPALFGVAELAAVPDAAILEQAALERARDPRTAGRPAWIPDAQGRRRLARWGWKASSADLKAQVEIALQRDMGVSTPGRPGPWGDCTPAETACRAIATASGRGEAEASGEVEALLVAYLGSLTKPPRAAAADGFDLFRRAGCADCHASIETGDGGYVGALTDLLLHDMGPGLDDGVGEGAARPAEWRTAPLWNLKAELDAGGLLHDGRARSVAEAVRWHGGQAAPSRERFFALPAAGQAVVTRFLMGL
jgi:CxxC motif-containing protein (DUF1111 family)